MEKLYKKQETTTNFKQKLMNRTSTLNFFSGNNIQIQNTHASSKYSSIPEMDNLNKLPTKLKQSSQTKFRIKENDSNKEKLIVSNQKLDYGSVKSKVQTNLITNSSKKNLFLQSHPHKFDYVELDTNKFQDENDEETLRRMDENVIKKLNFWEFQQVLSKNPLKSKTDDSNTGKSIYTKELEKINWINELKEDLQKLHFNKADNPDMGIFFRKDDEEHQSLYLQNVNLAKKQFNFDIFQNKNTSSQKIMKKISTEKISNVNFYRGIIKEKIKLEFNFRKDIIDSSTSYYDKKVDKNKMKNEKFKLIYELNQAKVEGKEKRKALEKVIKDVQTLYTQRINSVTNDNLTTQTKKDSNSFNESNSYTLQSDFYKYFSKINIELESLNKEYDNKIIEHEKNIDQLNKNLDNSDKEIQIIKHNIDTMIKDQREYYLEILKIGIDVRPEGLTWVVKRLIEFNSFFEYSMFPRFLENSQIDFLLKYSYKTTENNILKMILKALKDKQKKIRDDDQQIYSPPKPKPQNFEQLFIIPPKSRRSYLNFLSETDLYALKNYYQHQQQKLSATFEKKIEDLEINNIILEYKQQFHLTKPSKVNKNEEGVLLKFFKENERQKESFEEIILLRDIIVKNEKEIDLLKTEEISKFTAKYDNYKASKNGNQIQLIYAALFGNGIFL